MSGIFISYRRDDSSGWAVHLYEYLVREWGPDKVFMDIDAIAPGENFREAIARTMRTCDVVLVVIGPNWVNSRDEVGNRRLDDEADTHRSEVASALAADVRVVPVRVGGAAMPKLADLPEPLKDLTDLNAAIIEDRRFASDASSLQESLKQFAEALAAKQATEEARRAADQVTARRAEQERVATQAAEAEAAARRAEQERVATQAAEADDVSAAGRRPEVEFGKAPGATQAADLPHVSASDRANEQNRTVSGAKRQAPDSDTAVEGGNGVDRRQRLTRPIVLVPALGAVALLAIGAAVAFSRNGGDEPDDLDVGSVESNFERVIDESTFVPAESEIPPDQCPLGDLSSMASVIDNAVPMSISITEAETFVEVDPDPDDGPAFIICGDEQLAVQLVASGVIGAETAKSELTALGAEEAGGHRNGQIVEWNEESSCASYWLSEDVNIVFSVILGGDECSTEASTLALTAVLPEMVRSLSSFRFTPSETTTPASVTTASAPSSFRS
jgi:TIR domain